MGYAEVLPLRRQQIIAGIPTREKHPYCNAFCRNWLLTRCLSAREHIEIVSDTLNPLVFDASIAHQIEHRLMGNALLRVRIITGPQILTLHGANTLCALSSLWCEDGYERLSLRSLATAPLGFQIIDSELYFEHPHHSGEVPTDVEVARWDFVAVEKYLNYFEELWGKARQSIVLLEEMRPSSPSVTPLRRSL